MAKGEAPGAEVDPRLFVIRLEGGDGPAYAICERSALVAKPAGRADPMADSLFKRIDQFFRDGEKAGKMLSAIGLPAELDPKGGGYMMMSSMGDDR
ncbi:hypothetical protein ABC347_01935 [Sphingomonas sp. 1P06PA]|uniref:hypothetical protein n=1 Tax=Sphingomonas sp. 1P06PA TaxID=554121 RepID=UPI0039A4A754